MFSFSRSRKREVHAKIDATVPAFVGQLAIYKDRYVVAKVICIAVALVSAALTALQEYRISKVTAALTEKDFLIVPGAPEFMRIRPGLIAPESVYLFAEWAASQLATFSYNTADTQFRALSDYMTPELKTRFLQSMERPLKMYKDLRVDQVFDIEPVKTFDLKNDARGAKYLVRVRGATRKYIEGNLRGTSPVESVSFVFRPRKIRPNQVWFFEIESFERMTSEDEDKLRALESLTTSEAK